MQIYPAIWDTVAIVTHPHAHLQAASQSQSQSLSLSVSHPHPHPQRVSSSFSIAGFMSTSYMLIHTVAQNRYAQLHSAAPAAAWRVMNML